MYNTSRIALLQCGLNTWENAPCLYIRIPIPGKDPLYLGMYVDDLIYFLVDKTVENNFETFLKLFLDVGISGTSQYFLGF